MGNIEIVGVEAAVLGFSTFTRRLNGMDRAIRGLGISTLASAGQMGGMSLVLGAIAVGAVAAVAGVVAISAAVVKLGSESVEVAASVETAFAGILKTTQGLGTNLFDLTEQGEEVFQTFRNLAKEIPLSFEDLARIGEVAGQLGIAEDQLADFTRTIAALGVSTDLTSEEAAFGIARLGAVFGIETAEMGEFAEQLGSALVFLGNNFAVTEQEILLGARNIAGTAAILGISAQDILAFSTAFKIGGVTAEAGGTAIQNALLEIDKAVREGGESFDILNELVSDSLAEGENFADVWERDATEGFILFVESLQRSGDDAAVVLENLDLDSARSLRTFLGLANASDVLVEAVAASNEAFEESTALTREAEIRYNTFDSQVQILKNQFRDLGLTIGLSIIPFLQDMFRALTPVIEAIGKELGPAMTDIAEAVRTDLLPALSDLFEALVGDVTLDDITEGITNFIGSISSGIEDFSTFVENMDALIQILQTEGFAAALESLGIPEETAANIERVAKAFGDIATSIGEIPTEIDFGEFFDIDAEALTGITENISGFFAGATEIIATVFDNLGKAAVEAFARNFANIGELILLAFSDKTEENKELFKQAFIDVFTGAIEGLNDLFTGIVVSFVSILGGPESGKEIKQGFVDLGNLIADVVKGSEFGQKLEEIFRELGEGWMGALGQGLADIWQTVVLPWFSDNIPKAIDGINDITETNSPSQVFEEIGMNWMEGLISGIDNQLGQVEATLANVGTQSMSAGQAFAPGVGGGNTTIDSSFNVGGISVIAQPQAPQTIASEIAMVAALQG